jgi:hypothetical protein
MKKMMHVFVHKPDETRAFLNDQVDLRLLNRIQRNWQDYLILGQIISRKAETEAQWLKVGCTSI